MSVQAMSAVFTRSRCGGTTRLVLLAIGNYYGDAGAWPSIDSLARDCLISRRAVQDCLRRAEAAGELHVEKNAGVKGTNRYWLHILDGGCRFCTRADVRRESAPEPLGTSGVGSGVGSTPLGSNSLAAARREREPDEIFEAIADACQIDWHHLTKAARGPLNTATGQLRAVGATPEEISRRASAYRRRYPETALTPMALAKHYPSLNGDQREYRPYDHVDYEAMLRES